MPVVRVRGIELNYEIVGNRGPCIALSPGSRHPYKDFLPLAHRLSAAGYRILLHDRRNCGASDVAIEGPDSENVLWADDLEALLQNLGRLPAFIGGSSAGCRLSIIFALRHPSAVKALLLWRITGGAHAAAELAETYYGQYITLAQNGGMAAVCASEHFAGRIKDKPSNRMRLMAMTPSNFIAVMSGWRDDFLRGADLPIIGASESDLRSIKAQACLIPGNDVIHNPAAARTLHHLLPHNELHDVVEQRAESDLWPEWKKAEWDSKHAEVVGIFDAFMRKVENRAQHG